MALSFKVGSFAQPTVTGNNAVTGVGFTPKVLIFFMTQRTSDGADGTTSRFGFGFVTSTSNRIGIGGGLTGLISSTRQDNTKCILITDDVDGLQAAADLTSFDADGFTLNWTTADATARIINYIALGGADLTNAFIKQITIPVATGNQASTGVGFKPDAIWIIGSDNTTTTFPSSISGYDLGMGFGTSATSRGVTSFGSPGPAWGNYQRTAQVYADVNTTTVTDNEGDLVSLDADGFTINWTKITADNAPLAWVLCLKGGKFKVGSFNQATATGNQATTGVNFQPVGLFLTSFDRVSATTAAAGVHNSYGAASGATSRGCIWLGGATNDSDNLDRTKIIKMLTQAVTTPTLNAAADFVSFDSNGFTLNWTTADATAREILYFAFGSAAAATFVRPSIFMNKQAVKRLAVY